MAAPNDPYEGVGIICVPSEAGTYFPGQSKAPMAILDKAQLGHKLQQAGLKVAVADDILNAAATKAAT